MFTLTRNYEVDNPFDWLRPKKNWYKSFNWFHFPAKLSCQNSRELNRIYRYCSKYQTKVERIHIPERITLLSNVGTILTICSIIGAMIAIDDNKMVLLIAILAIFVFAIAVVVTQRLIQRRIEYNLGVCDMVTDYYENVFPYREYVEDESPELDNLLVEIVSEVTPLDFQSRIDAMIKLLQ